MADDFERFFEARQKAASAYVTGDGAPVDAIVPHGGEASFHSPGGDTVTGASTVANAISRMPRRSIRAARAGSRCCRRE